MFIFSACSTFQLYLIFLDTAFLHIVKAHAKDALLSSSAHECHIFILMTLITLSSLTSYVSQLTFIYSALKHQLFSDNLVCCWCFVKAHHQRDMCLSLIQNILNSYDSFNVFFLHHVNVLCSECLKHDLQFLQIYYFDSDTIY